MPQPIKYCLVFILLFGSKLATGDPRNGKTDTIFFKDSSYLLLRDSVIIMNETAMKIAATWKSDTTKWKKDIARVIYHSEGQLRGIKETSIIQLLGEPDWYGPVRYKYERDYLPDGTYAGCWITFGFNNGAVVYCWPDCQ